MWFFSFNVYQEEGVTKVAELDKMLSPEARTIMHHVLRDFRRDARYSKPSDHSVIPEQKLFTRVNNIGSRHLYNLNVSKLSCSRTLQCDGEIHFWTPSGCHCCVSFHFCVTVLHSESYNVLFHRIKDNVLFMNCVHLKMKILSSFTHFCCPWSIFYFSPCNKSL